MMFRHLPAESHKCGVDNDDRPQAIEFYGSRYGSFVSRDPGLKPVFPGELKQLKDGPIYITARITGDPD